MGKLAKDEMRKLHASRRPASSTGIGERLIALATELRVNVIASYIPLATEPDVAEFNRWAISRELLFPRIAGDDLAFASGELLPGPFGLLEPNGRARDKSEIEFIVVPAMAADLEGNRLGKGKGYYDRTLKDLNAIKVAAIFDGELVTKIPTESHDARVDYIVTPTKTIRVES